MALIKLSCPSCQGRVEVSDDLKTATCIYCGTQVLIDSPNIHKSTPPPASASSATPLAQEMAKDAAKKLSKGCMIVFFSFIFLAIFSAIMTTVFNTEEETPIPPVANSRVEQQKPPNTPAGIPVITAEEFISAAEKMGYEIIIEDDYDDFNTYWAGAFLFKPDETVKKEGNEIYVIDYTRDATIHNSKVEYLLYVDNVKAIGGESASDSAVDWSYQLNISDEQIGIAYRVNDVNMYVVAPAEHKETILNFFDAIGFGVSLD